MKYLDENAVVMHYKRKALARINTGLPNQVLNLNSLATLSTALLMMAREIKEAREIMQQISAACDDSDLTREDIKEHADTYLLIHRGNGIVPDPDIQITRSNVHYFQAQMLEIGSQVEYSGVKGRVYRRKFDETGIVTHVAFEWEDGHKSDFVDVRDMSGIKFVPRSE